MKKEHIKSNHSDISIQKAEEKDFNQIIELFKAFADFEKMPHKMTNTAERMQAEKAYFNSFVAKAENGSIIGYVTYFFCYFTWIGKSLYMDDLYVTPEFRGKGIGTRLIKEVMAFAQDSGCHKMRWQVSSWNDPAINFYKSLGAEIDGIEKNCDLYFR